MSDENARLVKILHDLRAPFPAAQIGTLPAVPGKRPALDFVGHAAVTDRLNDVEPTWTYTLDRIVETVEDEDHELHVLAVIGTIKIAGISRPEVGDVERFSTYGQELKEAIGNLIRRGAMRFGVALDLWSRQDLGAGGSEDQGEGSSGSPVSTGARATRGSARAPERGPGGAELTGGSVEGEHGGQPSPVCPKHPDADVIRVERNQGGTADACGVCGRVL